MTPPPRSLKSAVLRSGLRLGFFRLLQGVLRRRQAAILTFHRFMTPGAAPAYGLPIARFEEYMAYLTRHYRVASLHTLTEELRRGKVRASTVAVTVDDGYADAFSLAAPIFLRHGIPASFFVVTDFIQGRLWLWTDRFRYVFHRAPYGNALVRHRGVSRIMTLTTEADRSRLAERWREYAKTLSVAEREDLLGEIAEAWGIRLPPLPPPEYRPMTWPELRTLAAQGFDVGAHTCSHPILSHVVPRKLLEEIEWSKEEIEQQLGVPVRHFAYPNGRKDSYTPAVIQAVEKSGYTAAVTMVPGGNTPDTPIFELHRIDAGVADLAHFAQTACGAEELKLAIGAGLMRIMTPNA